MPNPAHEVAVARRAARTAQLVAAAALVVALLAVVLSMAALANRRSDTNAAGATVTSAADAPPAGSESATATTEPQRTSAANQTTTVDTRQVEPQAEFTVEYENQVLRIQPPVSCGDYRYVDLDEPRVGVAVASAEFGYGDSCGGKAELALTVDDISISNGTSDAKAGDCAEEIRNGPINDLFVPVKDMSLCLVTSPRQAENEGSTRKVVLLTVNEIAADGSMVLTVTAWNVPR